MKLVGYNICYMPGFIVALLLLGLIAGCNAFDDNAEESGANDPTPTIPNTPTTEPSRTSPPTATPEPPAPTNSPTPAATLAPPDSTPTATLAPPDPTPSATTAPTAAPLTTPTIAAEPTATPEPSPVASDVWNLRQFETSEQVMILTFDAGADRGYTEDILDILAAEGINASFGMTGPWAEENPDLLARIVDEGHQLINHSWSHPHFPELTSEERAAELHRLEDLVRAEVGVEMQPYFRPPFGEYDDATLEDLARNGYTVNVMWTVDTLGWNGLSAAEINARVMEAAAPGAIVLMHVGSQSQDAIALPEMIRLLRERGYSFATVAELARQ